jgi:hypothetical protein
MSLTKQTKAFRFQNKISDLLEQERDQLNDLYSKMMNAESDEVYEHYLNQISKVKNSYIVKRKRLLWWYENSLDLRVAAFLFVFCLIILYIFS